MLACARHGIASIVGTIVFVVVFMLALGMMAYFSGLQAQSSRAQVQAESLNSAKGNERLDFAGSSATLSAENGGGVSVEVNHLVLTYPNGTVYAIPVSAAIPAGGELGVASMVPPGACLPGTSTCQSRYAAVADGSAPGSTLGLVTSLGNTFWYDPGMAQGGSGSTYYRATSVESTTSTTYVGIGGLSFDGAAGGSYMAQVYVGYWQSGVTPNSAMFAASVPSGATFMFCGGMYYSGSGTLNAAPQNMCSSAPGQTLGLTGSSEAPCTSSNLACEFVGTAFVTFTSAGVFQLEYEGTPSGAANVFADSVLVVSQIS